MGGIGLAHWFVEEWAGTVSTVNVQLFNGSIFLLLISIVMFVFYTYSFTLGYVILAILAAIICGLGLVYLVVVSVFFVLCINVTLIASFLSLSLTLCIQSLPRSLWHSLTLWLSVNAFAG